MSVWLTAPGMYTCAAIEVYLVVICTASQHEEACVQGIAFGVQMLPMCWNKNWNVAFLHNALTTWKREAQTAIMKLLPCV